ncbi:MAG: MATE family efflux transporter [Gammaproteobacteria bacterium]|nr:MATE family efflux transporter [Gammaproteobacteria bacterium]
MALTQFFIMSMGFLDTAMAGHYSASDLAGVALGGSIMWPVFMLLSGVTLALTPITAQLRGAGREGAVGAKLHQGIWISVIGATGIVAIMITAGEFLAFMDIDSEVIRIADEYLDAAAWGMPAVLVYITLRYTSEGLGKTVAPMIIAGSALALNAVLNYAFIYGRFGAPELGGVGCGYATSIVMWFELALMSILLTRPYFRRTNVLAKFAPPDLATIGEILRIGIPIGISSFVGMAIFSVISFMVATLGVVALAAHSIAGHINWATFVIPMSIGSAASIRVGFLIGSGELERARVVGYTALKLALGYAVCVSVTLVVARHQVVQLYGNDPEVLATAATLILFIALYQIADDTQATVAGVLRGFKDTRVPMFISLVGYWIIALPIGAWLGFGDYGVYGFWIGLTVGLAAVAIGVSGRFWSTSRNTERIRRLALEA